MRLPSLISRFERNTKSGRPIRCPRNGAGWRVGIVVVAPPMRGRGYARLLYTDLFEQARRAAHRFVVYEINTDPPNPASDAFHAAFKFEEVGRSTIHQGSKSVPYLAFAL